MKAWRFIETQALSPYSNMAIDEALFTAFSPGNVPVLRFYSWLPYSFSIGYSQDPAIELNLEKCRSRAVPFTRRITGGGVIFHGRGLTYSLVCSENDIPMGPFAKETYKKLCSFIIHAYRSMGLESGFSLEYSAPPKKGWICLSRRERYDVIIAGKKIGGNAQKRKKGVVFQHGFVPFYPDTDKVLDCLNNACLVGKNKTCALGEALGRDIEYEEFKKVLAYSFEKTFSVRLAPGTLNPLENNLYDRLLQSKYKTTEWNFLKHAYKNKTAVA
jgi:lipoyl(octanoyl) transferase